MSTNQTFEFTIKLTQAEVQEIVTSYVRRQALETHHKNRQEDFEDESERKRIHLNQDPVWFDDIVFYPIESVYGELEYRVENANGNVLFFVASLPTSKESKCRK